MSEALELAQFDVECLVADRAVIVNQICERLAKGEPLASICRDPEMPSAFDVWNYQDRDDSIKAAIARAREIGEEAIALDAQLIVDGLKPVPGVPVEAARDKARAEVRLKLLAKFNPKRWGESTQLRHADADGAKLDTAPLVGELLGLMNAPGVQLATAAPVTARLVSESRIEAPRAPPASDKPRGAYARSKTRPAYRARAAGVNDLI